MLSSCRHMRASSPAVNGKSFLQRTRPVRSTPIVYALALTEGCKVKVAKSIIVFHVPKKAEGFDLEGLEGVLAKDVTEYKGQTLSANLQYKVDFKLPAEPKPIKFSAHLSDDELEVIP